MRFGLFLPAMADYADARRVADLAGKAEEVGWDGLFLWDHIIAWPELPVADTWVTLTAAAGATSTIRLGSMVTPLARRRPWVLARQLATLDRFCGGRLVAGIGLGDDGWREFSSFGEAVEPTRRRELLDESLDVLRQCLSGQPVEHHGAHLRVVGAMVAHATRLRRASRRVGLGVEVHHHRSAVQLRELDGVAILVGEREVGGLVSGFEHALDPIRLASPQQPRQAPVLEHAPLRLAAGAVGDHVILEVDRLERGRAARARLALVAVDAQRQRQLVGDRQTDRLLVVCERAAERLDHRVVQPLRLVLVEVGAALVR